MWDTNNIESRVCCISRMGHHVMFANKLHTHLLRLALSQVLSCRKWLVKAVVVTIKMDFDCNYNCINHWTSRVYRKIYKILVSFDKRSSKIPEPIESAHRLGQIWTHYAYSPITFCLTIMRNLIFFIFRFKVFSCLLIFYKWTTTELQTQAFVVIALIGYENLSMSTM